MRRRDIRSTCKFSKIETTAMTKVDRVLFLVTGEQSLGHGRGRGFSESGTRGLGRRVTVKLSCAIAIVRAKGCELQHVGRPVAKYE